MGQGYPWEGLHTWRDSLWRWRPRSTFLLRWWTHSIMAAPERRCCKPDLQYRLATRYLLCLLVWMRSAQESHLRRVSESSFRGRPQFAVSKGNTYAMKQFSHFFLSIFQTSIRWMANLHLLVTQHLLCQIQIGFLFGCILMRHMLRRRPLPWVSRSTLFLLLSHVISFLDLCQQTHCI